MPLPRSAVLGTAGDQTFGTADGTTTGKVVSGGYTTAQGTALPRWAARRSLETDFRAPSFRRRCDSHALVTGATGTATNDLAVFARAPRGLEPADMGWIALYPGPPGLLRHPSLVPRTRD